MKFKTSSTRYTYTGCFVPLVTLIPATSSLGSPLQYRRNQEFFISSRIDLTCNSSLLITARWTITKCTPVCSSPIATDLTVIKTFAEIYIPSRTLASGLYQLQLTVTMTMDSSISSTGAAYVRITPSGIAVGMVPYRTSMITHGYAEALTLDPGSYSTDLDGSQFNASVCFKYFSRRSSQMCLFSRRTGLMSTIVVFMVCQVFRAFLARCCPSTILGWILSIPHASSIDHVRGIHSFTTCLTRGVITGNGTLLWQYASQTISPKSSVIVQSRALAFNRTYQWIVYMVNRRNTTLQAKGHLLVRIDDTGSPMIDVA